MQFGCSHFLFLDQKLVVGDKKYTVGQIEKDLIALFFGQQATNLYDSRSL